MTRTLCCAVFSHSVMSSSDSNPQDLVKLRFLMSHHRENSLRNKEMGKKWIYLFKFKEKHTPQTMWAIAEGKCGHEL